MSASSCSLFSGKSQNEIIAKKKSATDASAGDEDYQEYKLSSPTDAGGRPHPRRSTAMSTLTLTRVHPQPDATALINCQDSVQALVAEGLNQQDMISVGQQVAKMAQADLTLYHWCFYHLMVQLDQDLAQADQLMAERARLFFASMKTLWVLARSLDQLTEDKPYFPYLRQRYIEMSRQSFGRDLEVVASPLDNDRLFYKNGKKPAAPAH